MSQTFCIRQCISEQEEAALYARFPTLPVRLWNAFYYDNRVRHLHGEVLLSFGEFLQCSDAYLLRLRNFGPKTLRMLRSLGLWNWHVLDAWPEWNAWADTLPAAWRSH